VEALRAAGVAVDDAEVPLREGSADMAQVWSGVLAAELAELGETAEAALSPGLRAVVRRGRGLGAVDLLRAATRAWEGVAPALARFHAGHDVLVTPTVPITAFGAGRQVPEGGEGSWIAWTPLTWPFNLTGQPAVTVPVGVDREGLPVGAQVVARRGHDEDALAVARLLEIVSGLRP
jgi:Asp-tRNA(Asn)/Glu-tRNA(Gln) amidotransferase A subunit family amidase